MRIQNFDYNEYQTLKKNITIMVFSSFFFFPLEVYKPSCHTMFSNIGKLNY